MDGGISAKWDDPHSVFFDFETVSACDLPKYGGRLYAEDWTTRILSLNVFADNVVYAWLPLHNFKAGTAPAVTHVSPGDRELADYIPQWAIDKFEGLRIEVHTSGSLPTPIRELVSSGRTFVAHNCFGFDRLIWVKHIPYCTPVYWADSLYMARAYGLPGGLDRLGKRLIDEGKDTAKLIAMPLTRARVHLCNVIYPEVGKGQIAPLVRYGVGDTLLLYEIWDKFEGMQCEDDVIQTHLNVNERGVQADRELLRTITHLSNINVMNAQKEITRLTNGGIDNYKSVKQVKDWLKSKGVIVRGQAMGDSKERKETLKKDVVEQCLASPEQMIDESSPVATTTDNIPPEVFDVLRIRSAALRISGAKANKAIIRASPADGRIRDLLSYYQANTGRWGSVGLQIHNLPRPKPGIDVFRLLGLHRAGKLNNDTITAYLEELELNEDDPKKRLAYSKYTSDDCLSALLRPSFVAKPGHVLCICDFNAIECRVTGWVAGEETLLNIFRAGGDPYKFMASKIYNIPEDSVNEEQRYVGKVVTLASGFQMSDNKLALYAALAGVNLVAAGVTAKECIGAFRTTYTKIAGSKANNESTSKEAHAVGGIWHLLNDAVLDTIEYGKGKDEGKCKWKYDGEILSCMLPSERMIYYQGAELVDKVPGYVYALGLKEHKEKPTAVYQHPRGYEAVLYGGKILENVVQGIARDCLARALVMMDEEGLNPVLHVHDEVVCEVEESCADETLERMTQIMSESPEKWGKDLPIGVEGFVSDRYVKKPQKGAKVIKK